MKNIKAILTLIRFPNLVFIFLTQLLAYYFIIKPSIDAQLATLNIQLTTFLYFSTVLIATAGYIINDYFDMGIDVVNKPHKITIEKEFSRRRIIIWHILLNVLGLMIAGYIAYHYVKLRFLSVQLLCVLLLLVYSTTFKRKLIIGNFTIAILTSLTLYMVALYEPQFHLFDKKNSSSIILWIYILFAFFITFIREIIKDIEDVKGDMVQQCETIPLVFGINTAKKFVYSLIAILLFILLISCICYLQNEKIVILVLSSGVALPLLIIMYLIQKATTSKEFHKISTYIKIITLIGILSMIFI